MVEQEPQAEFSLFMWGNGGDWFRNGKWAIDNPQNVAALTFMRRLASEGLTERLVDNADTLVTQRGTEGVAYRYIKIMSLFLEANGLINMFSPASQPAHQVQGESLASTISDLGRELLPFRPRTAAFHSVAR